MLCERPAEVERGRRQRREKQMKERSRAGKVANVGRGVRGRYTLTQEAVTEGG